jgi:hypothetical protein
VENQQYPYKYYQYQYKYCLKIRNNTFNTWYCNTFVARPVLDPKPGIGTNDDDSILIIDDDQSYSFSMVSEVLFQMLRHPNMAIAGSGANLDNWQIDASKWPISATNCNPYTNSLSNY